MAGGSTLPTGSSAASIGLPLDELELLELDELELDELDELLELEELELDELELDDEPEPSEHVALPTEP
jgi:hypothetical protein